MRDEPVGEAQLVQLGGLTAEKPKHVAAVAVMREVANADLHHAAASEPSTPAGQLK